MKPEELPGACARVNHERSEALRVAAAELRRVSETLRAEARELVASAADIRSRCEDVIDLCMKGRHVPGAPTGAPQAIRSLYTRLCGKL